MYITLTTKNHEKKQFDVTYTPRTFSANTENTNQSH